MNLSIGPRWEKYVDELLRIGRYGSASEIVREGLRLVEEREAALAGLRAKIEGSLERGGENGADDARAAVAGTLAEWSERNQRAA